MRLNRTGNAKRNIVFGVLLNVYKMIMPFILRTIMIYTLGVEYLGLGSLFASILQVLNLAELGVGSAMVYAMYRPIAEEDIETTCAYLQLYKKYYFGIGAVIAVSGLAATPFVPHLIKGDIPENINVHILFLLNLAVTVNSYWGFAYRSSVATAYQRVDLLNKIDIITLSAQCILQAIVLLLFRNYYFYTIAYVLAQIMNNMLIGIVMNKKFPQVIPKGVLKPEIVKETNRRIGALFTAKIGTVVVDSADTIVISAFLGLAALAVYQNYFFIITTILAFVSIIFRACMAGIGNSIIVETKQKNYADFELLTFIIIWIAGFCTACFLCLFQPFMEIWVGKDLMLSFPMVICFCIYYFVYEINQLLNSYKDAAGIWQKDRFRPLVTALSNLALNLLMVNKLGLFGILLSTILTMLFVGMPWLIHNLFSEVFDRDKMLPYVKKLLWYVGCVTGSSMATFLICGLVRLEGIGLLLSRAVLCCIIPNVCFLALFRSKPEFAQALQLADIFTNGKLMKWLKKRGHSQ